MVGKNNVEMMIWNNCPVDCFGLDVMWCERKIDIKEDESAEVSLPIFSTIIIQNP